MLNDEEIFVGRCIVHFSKHFTCRKEVWSKCGKGRIDILLSTVNDEHFGIEAKIPDRKRGEKLGEYVKQAVRYTGYEFQIRPNEYRKIPIFICPAISYKYFILNEQEMLFEGNKWHKDRHKEDFDHHTFNGFIGCWNIGEVKNVGGTDFALMFSNKIIYDTRMRKIYEGNTYIRSEKKGLHIENYKLLLKKISV